MVAKGNKLIPAVLKKSQSFKQDFNLLIALSKEKIEKLAVVGESEYGFNIPDELIGKISKDVGVKEEELETILKVVQFFYHNAFSQEIDADEAAREICRLAEDLGAKDCADKHSVIRHLLERKPLYDYRMLKDEAEAAVVPIITSTHIECDVRAITHPKTDELLGYIPMALVHIEIEKQNGETESVTFQMKAEHIDELSQYLERAKGVMANLEKKFGGKKSS